MSELSYLEKLLDGVEVEWVALNHVFDIFAGGDVPKDSFSDVQTTEYNIPILSNGIGDKSLYGWTDTAKIHSPSLTISARGTIGWTSYRETPFFPIVRLLVLTPKIQLNLKYAYYFMKMIEGNYNVPKTGIPQLTKPMLKDITIPIPCSSNPEKSLAIQSEIVRILDKFTALTAELTTELTTELTARKKQYNYYRDQLLSFKEGEVEWKTLGEIAEISTGQKPSVILELPTEFDYINAGTIRSGYTTLSNCEGDTVTTPSRGQGGIGFVGYQKDRFWLGPLCYKMRAVDKEVLINKYLFYFLQSESGLLLGLKKEGGVPAVNKSDLAKIQIPIPSINKQKMIISILDSFNALTNSITEGLPREIELRQKQYEYYRDLMFNFPKSNVKGGS
ncbi:restriction endonuclease subunit S [Duffyella gerundensis]|uniref:restriction endonuclease subunit S n=1 Tax=Duffyella gerundensis TaxID=1619313 RepID=UPI001653F1DC|nr:restriction endonuclease subunit S [Duffyella gerundensis]